MGTALNIATQASTVLGSRVVPGMVIRNPKSTKKQVMFVIGGSELSKFGIARLLTNLPAQSGAAAPNSNNFHQTLFAWSPQGGSAVDEPGYCYPIQLDRSFELIATFDRFTNG